MSAILFNWIINGIPQFATQFRWASLFIGIVFFLLTIVFFENSNNNIRIRRTHTFPHFYTVSFVAMTLGGLYIFSHHGGFTQRHISQVNFVSPYLIFDLVFPIFLILGLYYLYEIITNQHNKILDSYYPIFVISGCYFAISYGCGTSGGLAEGQAYWGVCLICGIVFFICSKAVKWKPVIYSACVLMCSLFVLICSGRKMVNTYNWWGMTQSNYWDSTEYIDDIPLLKGLYLSPDTHNVYYDIYKNITELTDSDDTIFCFPQIPIFYSICDRNDPGVYSKVQWFDVVTDDALEHDINVLIENPPKAVLIYNTKSFAYDGHEEAFRSGKTSGTRRMRDFLWDYVLKNEYTFIGTFQQEGNSLSLWIDLGESREAVFSKGSGSEDDPYVISTAQQLCGFSDIIRSGNIMEGKFVELDQDIDLSSIESFSPIGRFESGLYFSGTFDGKGHIIRNLTIKEDSNVGLFGVLNGSVRNLGIENADIQGSGCNGIIASHGSDCASIINCYSQGKVFGFRAGGLCDNFEGTIENCWFSGELSGNSAGCISYTHNVKNSDNIFILNDNIFSSGGVFDTTLNSVVNCTKEEITSPGVLSQLNNYAMNDPALCTWIRCADGFPRLELS